MSTSRHFDTICVIIVVLSLLLTVLFMNGGALGITVLANDEAADPFTDGDLNSAWSADSATRITLTGDGASIAGNGAYAVNGSVHIVYAGNYVITGELTDGSIVIDADGDDKIRLLFDNVTLNCSDSAALIVAQADKVFLTLAEGSVNTIAAGEAYSDDAVADGIDGAIYSRDDLTINGSGSLTVTAAYRHGIVANDDLVITGGTIEITAAEDGVHANDSFRFTAADLTIAAGDDGITVSNDDGSDQVYIESGSILITECYEGIEGTVVTVAGGEIEIHPSDDGINAESEIRVTGGSVRILNANGRDADGFDSNGDIIIDGGYVFISLTGSDGGNCALDYGSERGGACVINGGTVIACGGSSMIEEISEASAQASLLFFPASAAENETILTLTDSDGSILISEKIPYAFSAAVLSAPELTVGDSVTVTVGDTAEEVSLDAVNTSNRAISAGMMGGMGGGVGRSGAQNRQSETAAGSAAWDFAGGERPAPPDMEGFPSDGDMMGNADGESDAQAMRGMRGGINGKMPAPPDMEGFPSDGGMPENADGESDAQAMRGMRGGMGRMDGMQSSQTDSAETGTISKKGWVTLGVSAAALLIGIVVSMRFRREGE